MDPVPSSPRCSNLIKLKSFTSQTHLNVQVLESKWLNLQINWFTACQLHYSKWTKVLEYSCNILTYGLGVVVKCFRVILLDIKGIPLFFEAFCFPTEMVKTQRPKNSYSLGRSMFIFNRTPSILVSLHMDVAEQQYLGKKYKLKRTH